MASGAMASRQRFSVKRKEDEDGTLLVSWEKLLSKAEGAEGAEEFGVLPSEASAGANPDDSLSDDEEFKVCDRLLFDSRIQNYVHHASYVHELR